MKERVGAGFIPALSRYVGSGSGADGYPAAWLERFFKT